MEGKIKYVKCEATGESLLEVSDGKISALADCDVVVRDGVMKAYKKGEVIVTLPKKIDSGMKAVYQAHYER